MLANLVGPPYFVTCGDVVLNLAEVESVQLHAGPSVTVELRSGRVGLLEGQAADDARMLFGRFDVKGLMAEFKAKQAVTQ